MTIQSTTVRQRTRPASEPAPTHTAPIQGGIAARAATGYSATPAASPAPAGWMKRGAVAKAYAEQEAAKSALKQAERDKKRRIPFRFKLMRNPQTQLFDPRELIILDDEPGPVFYEHNLKDDFGNWGIFETCPKEFADCPLCAGARGAKPSYLVMLLTVIDLTPYNKKDRDGNFTGETVPFSYRILAVKHQDHGFFHRLHATHGSLRGVQLLMTRDTDTSPAYGRPEFIARHDEAAIIQSFQHPEVRSDQGQIIKKANQECYPLAYEEVIEAPDPAKLRLKYGGTAPVGARSQTQGSEWGDHDPGMAQPQARIGAQRTQAGFQAPSFEQAQAAQATAQVPYEGAEEDRAALQGGAATEAHEAAPEAPPAASRTIGATRAPSTPVDYGDDADDIPL